MVNVAGTESRDAHTAENVARTCCARTATRLSVMQHVAGTKFAQNSCCTSLKSITTHGETSPFDFVSVLSQLHVPAARFLCVQHAILVAAICSCSISPRVPAVLFSSLRKARLAPFYY